VSNPASGSQTVIVQVGPQGYPTANPAYVSGPPKSRVAAGLLGIFLGVFGVHRFYLGYTGLGVLMLLLTILSIGILAPFIALWGLIEGIVILCGGIKTDRRGIPLN
jgi:TM2 domain-containing membrane protein YozV